MRPVEPSIFSEFAKRFGLDKTQATLDITELAGMGPGTRFLFHLRLPVSVDALLTSHPEMKVLFEVQRIILESPLVQEELKALNSRIKELETEVESLKKYKTHYDLAYDLAQGKETVINEVQKS